MSNFGHSRALETPGGDLGFQGPISGSNTGRKSSFGAPMLGCFLDTFGVCFRGASWEGLWITFFFSHDFGMILGSLLGSFS